MLILYRIYQCVIMIPVLLVVTILTALLTILFSFIGLGRSLGYYIPMIWAKMFCWLSLVRVEVRRKGEVKPGQSYVFVANHQGAYDIFAIYGYLGHNFRWMMKKALEKIPLVGYSCRVSGHIYVDTSSPKATKETMETAEKRLAGGMSVVVFPEGTRSATGEIGKFRRGAFFLATEFKLPVVPITIDGAYDILPKNAKLPHWGKIILTIHPAIHPGAEGHDLPALMEQSRAAIMSAL